MCGRFVLAATEDQLCGTFGITEVHQSVSASYNVAPGQKIAAIVQRGDERHLGHLEWGLIPHWTRTLDGARRPINARSETVHEKPSFRDAFRKRRCLIPANGFYEWQKTPKGKLPFYIHLADAPLFAMAGLWERWRSPDGTSLTTCTILTTNANDALHPIHDRMPVLLPPDAWNLWMDNAHTDPAALHDLLQPYPSQAFAMHTVSPRVNRVTHNAPDCIEPYDPPPPPGNLSLF